MCWFGFQKTSWVFSASFRKGMKFPNFCLIEGCDLNLLQSVQIHPLTLHCNYLPFAWIPIIFLNMPHYLTQTLLTHSVLFRCFAGAAVPPVDFYFLSSERVFPRGTIAGRVTGFWKLWVTARACGWLALPCLMSAGVVSSDKTVGLVINQQAKHRSSFFKCLPMVDRCNSVYHRFQNLFTFTPYHKLWSTYNTCLKINLSPKHRVSALSWLNTNPAAVICHTEMCSLAFLSLFNVVTAAKIQSEHFSR